MKNPLRSGSTPYDDFLLALFGLLSGLNPSKRAIMASLWDGWQTDDGYQLLNAVYSGDRRDPESGAVYSPPLATEASEVIAWKCEGGPRPAWLRTITDAELAAL